MVDNNNFNYEFYDFQQTSCKIKINLRISITLNSVPLTTRDGLYE